MTAISPKDEAARERIFAALDNAFAYSNFADPNFRKLVRKFITVMENDLDSCQWSPESRTEKLAEQIEQYVSSLNTPDKPEISVVEKIRVDDEEAAKPEILEMRKEKDDDLPSTTDV